MTGFANIEAGYVVALSTLSIYAVTLARREHTIGRRLHPRHTSAPAAPADGRASPAPRSGDGPTTGARGSDERHEPAVESGENV
jgi:hypothetical protein